MRLKIVQAGEPVLRAQARQLTREEIISDEIQRLIRDMQETMRDAPGVGLAASQVGMALQLAVIEDREELLSSLPSQELAEKERKTVPFHVIINPEITLLGDATADFYEGCLSLSGFSASGLLCGGVGDAAFIDVCNPSDFAADVDVRFGHVPFKALVRGMLGLDEDHDGFSVESGATIEYVKIRCNDGVEFRHIVCAGCSEYCARCIDDFLLIGGDALLLGSRGRDVCRKD
jgi:peptide deformylase